MSPQTDFDICCTLFALLQNGEKKTFKNTLEWCRKIAYNVDHPGSTYRKNLL
jgi:hypothetical protein